MKSSRLLWGSVGIIALLTTCLFVFGLIYAVKEILYPIPVKSADSAAGQEITNNPLAKDKIQIVTLGDSLTRGTGDQTGKGYVTNVKEMLEEVMDKPVYVIGNFSVNGYRTDQLLKDLETKSTVVDTLKQANLIMLTIGGNDIFQLARNELDLTTEINPVALYERLPEATKRLDQILTRLARLNPKATIIYVGLYNPFLDMDETGKSSLVIEEWNDKAFKIVNRYPNMTLVSTFDLFEIHHNKYLYSDHFHPNKEGYERIAERIVQALE